MYNFKKYFELEEGTQYFGSFPVPTLVIKDLRFKDFLLKKQYEYNKQNLYRVHLINHNVVPHICLISNFQAYLEGHMTAHYGELLDQEI